MLYTGGAAWSSSWTGGGDTKSDVTMPGRQTDRYFIDIKKSHYILFVIKMIEYIMYMYI